MSVILDLARDGVLIALIGAVAAFGCGFWWLHLRMLDLEGRARRGGAGNLPPPPRRGAAAGLSPSPPAPAAPAPSPARGEGAIAATGRQQEARSGREAATGTQQEARRREAPTGKQP